MIEKVIKIAKKASIEIMKIYDSEEFGIENKDDNSPVTKADLIANKIIIDGLMDISKYPIVTEETQVKYINKKKVEKVLVS